MRSFGSWSPKLTLAIRLMVPGATCQSSGVTAVTVVTRHSGACPLDRTGSPYRISSCPGLTSLPSVTSTELDDSDG
jgi:hypothetical protein